jgi:hypothetical protein
MVLRKETLSYVQFNHLCQVALHCCRQYTESWLDPLVLLHLPLFLCLQGIKLYWHVLEAMLKAEEARAGLPVAGEWQYAII